MSLPARVMRVLSTVASNRLTGRSSFIVRSFAKDDPSDHERVWKMLGLLTTSRELWLDGRAPEPISSLAPSREMPPLPRALWRDRAPPSAPHSGPTAAVRSLQGPPRRIVSEESPIRDKAPAPQTLVEEVLLLETLISTRPKPGLSTHPSATREAMRGLLRGPNAMRFAAPNRGREGRFM